MENNSFNIGTQILLRILLATRMLIQGGSGSGKSYLMRKMLEVFSGHVQQIVFDWEGEFITLREKFPFALMSTEDGDLPLSVEHAAFMATKVLETGLSVIIDLSTLKKSDRLLFAHAFLDGMMEAPKTLWHPALIYIDEAHLYCPESKSSPAMDAVNNVATRGRKRGWGLVLSTQRISKLHKDAVAECQNKLIGKTILDIDQVRAASELGMAAAEKHKLRTLHLGEFYYYGPAFGDAQYIFRDHIPSFVVAPVETTHQVPGSGPLVIPPTPTAILSILEGLKDIPEQAEKDLHTKEGLLAKVAQLQGIINLFHSNEAPQEKFNHLRGELLIKTTECKVLKEICIEKQGIIDQMTNLLLSINKLSQTAISITVPDHEVDNTSGEWFTYPDGVVGPAPNPELLKKGVSQLTFSTEENNGYGREYGFDGSGKAFYRDFQEKAPGINGYGPAIFEQEPEEMFTGSVEKSSWIKEGKKLAFPVMTIGDPDNLDGTASLKEVGPDHPAPSLRIYENLEILELKDPAIRPLVSPSPDPRQGKNKLPKCDFTILSFLAGWDRGFSVWIISFATSYSQTSSGFQSAFTNLKRLGLIEKKGDEWYAIDSAIIKGSYCFDAIFEKKLTAYSWDRYLNKAALTILTILRGSAKRVFTRQELADKAGLSITSSGFQEVFTRLERLEMITRTRQGINFNPDLIHTI